MRPLYRRLHSRIETLGLVRDIGASAILRLSRPRTSSVNLHGKEHEGFDASSAITSHDNILPAILGLVGIAAVVSVTWALEPSGGRSREELTHCASITNDRARLTCYDQAAAPRPPAKGAFAPAQIEPPEGSL